MVAHPKHKREIDKDYLNFIRQQPCLVSKTMSEPHHTISVGAGGNDYYAVPLSRTLHSECHSMGKATFQKKYGIIFSESVTELLIKYIKKLKDRK